MLFAMVFLSEPKPGPLRGFGLVCGWTVGSRSAGGRSRRGLGRAGGFWLRGGRWLAPAAFGGRLRAAAAADFGADLAQQFGQFAVALERLDGGGNFGVVVASAAAVGLQLFAQQPAAFGFDLAIAEDRCDRLAVPAGGEIFNGGRVAQLLHDGRVNLRGGPQAFGVFFF